MTLTTKDYDYIFKILVIGDSSVGKSCLLLRYADDAFAPSYITTIGVDFKIKTILVNGTRVKLQIWDTAGQERFRTMVWTYYRDAHGVVVVFDLTNGESFANIRRWLGEMDRYCENVQKLLVGNKCDDHQRRVVPSRDAQRVADNMSVKYFETSAKENINVQEAFYEMACLVLQSRLARETKDAYAKKHPTKPIKLDAKPSRSSGLKKCC